MSEPSRKESLLLLCRGSSVRPPTMQVFVGSRRRKNMAANPVAYSGYCYWVCAVCDVTFTFQNQRFGEVFWHNACHYTRSHALSFQGCSAKKSGVGTAFPHKIKRKTAPNISNKVSNRLQGFPHRITERWDQAIITAKISDCTLKLRSKTHLAR